MIAGLYPTNMSCAALTYSPPVKDMSLQRRACHNQRIFAALRTAWKQLWPAALEVVWAICPQLNSLSVWGKKPAL